MIEFGWSEQFAQFYEPRGDTEVSRVLAEHRDLYRVQTAGGPRTARLAGRTRHQSSQRCELPAVGDWVVVRSTPAPDELPIVEVLPRTSKFSRKVAGSRTTEQVVAANVDFVWIVSSVDRDFSLRRIERYLTLTWESGASPVIVLTKADLADHPFDHVAAHTLCTLRVQLVKMVGRRVVVCLSQ